MWQGWQVLVFRWMFRCESELWLFPPRRAALCPDNVEVGIWLLWSGAASAAAPHASHCQQFVLEVLVQWILHPQEHALGSKYAFHPHVGQRYFYIFESCIDCQSLSLQSRRSSDIRKLSIAVNVVHIERKIVIIFVVLAILRIEHVPCLLNPLLSVFFNMKQSTCARSFAVRGIWNRCVVYSRLLLLRVLLYRAFPNNIAWKI